MSEINYLNKEKTQELINEIKDRLDSKEPKIFYGTLEQWNALTDDEKANYNTVKTPENVGAIVVDTVEADNMNAVTSNAVYRAVQGSGAGNVLKITFDDAFVGLNYTITSGATEIITGVVPITRVVKEIVQDCNTEYTVTCTIDNVDYTGTVVTGSYYGQYDVTVSYVHIYGASWDGTSTTAWTRTDESADFVDPVPYVAGATTYGSPFDTLQPWAGMQIVDRAGGKEVSIPKFYYKLGSNNGGLTIQIADKATAGFSPAPLHMDRGDGKGERDVAYIGRFHCASDYMSKTGVKPVANITRSAARTSIHNLGANFWQADFAARFTLWLLYIVEFADWNSQAKIGKGCGDNSATGNMGYTDSMPYHTGTTQTSRDTYGFGTQYRYIEGLWDNVYDWCDGCYYNDNGLNIILNPANFSDTSGGTLVGLPSSGYPSAFTVSDAAGFKMFYASEANNGSDSTYSTDGWGYNASGPCLCVGGSYSQVGGYGLFLVSYSATTGAGANIGSRLLELP